MAANYPGVNHLFRRNAMPTRSTTIALWAAKGLAGAAFLAAGAAKLAGVSMMVATFDAIGVGQWFRYLTGLIEVGSAILLFIPGLQALGAGLLVCTMIGAILAHLTILGPSAIPALVLGLISAAILWAHRDQLPVAGRRHTA
jgi:putative oxidoreductase